MKIYLQRRFKIFLFIFSIILLTIISILQRGDILENKISTEQLGKEFKPPFLLKRRHFDPNSIDQLPMNQLLDMNNFTFYNNCPNLCAENSGLYLFAFVHSATNHFKARRVIRKTWASPSTQVQLKFRVAFLLGDPKDATIQQSIDRESDQYHDIIQGNFIDNYQNLTYKHLMGYKWVLKYCRAVPFVFKADDDAFIDIFALILYAQKNFFYSNQPPKNLLGCFVNLKEDIFVQRNGKHKLSYQEYPYKNFPSFCSGIGYLVTPDVINDLYYASFKVKPFLWIDDVFVTGILPSVYSLLHVHMELEYTYRSTDLRLWLNNKVLKPSPYMIGYLDDVLNWTTAMFRLWKKTAMAWKWKAVNETHVQIINPCQMLIFTK